MVHVRKLAYDGNRKEYWIRSVVLCYWWIILFFFQLLYKHFDGFFIITFVICCYVFWYCYNEREVWEHLGNFWDTYASYW